MRPAIVGTTRQEKYQNQLKLIYTSDNKVKTALNKNSAKEPKLYSSRIHTGRVRNDKEY